MNILKLIIYIYIYIYIFAYYYYLLCWYMVILTERLLIGLLGSLK